MSHQLPRSIALLCLFVALLPATTSAAALAQEVKLRDLVALVQGNKKPLSFRADFTGSSGVNSGTLTLEGVQNGNMKTLVNAKADVTATLKLNLESGSVHAKTHVILVNNTLHARLDEFTITGKEAQRYLEQVKPYMRQWFSFPIDPNEYKVYQESRNKRRSLRLKILEPFFDIKTTTSRDKTQYSITLPRENQKRLLLALGKGTRGLSPRYDAVMRKAARTTDIMLDVVLTTVLGSFDSVDGTASVVTRSSSKSARFSVHSKAHVLSSVPRIEAPVDSVPIETFIQNRVSSSSGEEYVPASIADARNAQRRSDVNTILNATYQYSIDHNGRIPVTITTKETKICRTGASSCAGLIDLDVFTGSYIVSIPVDPLSEDPRSTEYTIKRDSTTGRVMVRAPLAEKGASISVTR